MKSFFAYWTAFLCLGTGTAGGILVLLAKYATPGARAGLWSIGASDRYELWKWTTATGFPVPETPAEYGGAYSVLFAFGVAILAVRGCMKFLERRAKTAT